MNIEVEKNSHKDTIEIQAYDEYGNKTVVFVDKNNSGKLNLISDQFIEAATQLRPAKDVEFIEKLFNELLTPKQKTEFLNKYNKPYEI